MAAQTAPLPVQQVPALRACALCMHSAVFPGSSQMVCLADSVIAIHGRATPVHTARATGSACGPDAHHLDSLRWRDINASLETDS